MLGTGPAPLVTTRMNGPNNGVAATTPTRSEILEGIAAIARDSLAWNGRLSGEMRLVEGIGLDSLRLLTLVVAVEDRFRICLDDEVDARIETVADLVDAIADKLGETIANPD